MAKFQSVFQRLKAAYTPFEPYAHVVTDTDDQYVLATQEVRAKDGYRTAFGGVETKLRYVSAHLMPVYVHKDMLQTLSPGLTRRMHGKSCFNFATEDEALFQEFALLVRSGFERFKADGRF